MNVSKKLICTFAALLVLGAPIYAQEAGIRAHVDERLELTSICQRLIGAQEYNQSDLTPYTEDIDEYFAEYKSHPLMEFLRQMRYKNIGYDAIPMSAVLLEIRNGQVRLDPDSDVKAKEALYKRWDKESHDEYIKLLDKFYKDTKFHRFYESHRALYSEAKEMFDSTYKIDTKWFEDTYGMPFGEKTVYLSLTNGWNNYGLSHTGDVVIGGFYHGLSQIFNDPDTIKRMRLSTGAREMLIHELTHTFVNNNIAKYDTAVFKHIEKIFPEVDTLMYAAACGPDAVWPEWVTRLGTILYFQDHVTYKSTIKYLVRADVDLGIIWQERSLDFLDYYRGNRDVYKTFLDFVPQLVGYLGFIADNFDDVQTEYENRYPYITEVYPAPHTQLDLSKDSVTITFSFSEDMSDGYGRKLLMRDNERLTTLFHNNDGLNLDRCFWKDDRTYVIKIATYVIKEAGIYGILLRNHVQDRFAYPLKEDFIVEYDLPNNE